MLRTPDYENGILNLACSVARHFGLDTAHPTLPAADRLLAGQPRNVVLMVFDALGYHNLQELLPEDSFLRRHLREKLSSVFPPTTTAAVTTLESGLSPAEHGWLGWTVRVAELSDNVSPFTNSGLSGKPAPYSIAEKLIPYESLVSRINAARAARAESISEFGTLPIQTLEEQLDTVAALCGEPGRHYLYTYWPEPDSSMHIAGVTSPRVREQALLVNAAVERLSARLTQTLLLLTADHGHIDIEPRLLTDYPDLTDTLECPPSIESRALAFFVKKGRKLDFEAAFRAHFGENFLLLPKAQVLDSGLFGPGTSHPRFEDFLGDYLAVATGTLALFNHPDQARKFKGFHAGLTEKEMLVPLIAVET